MVPKRRGHATPNVGLHRETPDLSGSSGSIGERWTQTFLWLSAEGKRKAGHAVLELVTLNNFSGFWDNIGYP
jgi:hypothetical protein